MSVRDGDGRSSCNPCPEQVQLCFAQAAQAAQALDRLRYILEHFIVDDRRRPATSRAWSSHRHRHRMMEIEPAATSRLTPIGNIYRCTYRRTNSSSDVSRSDKSKATDSRLSCEIQRSVSLNPSPSRRKSPSRNDDVSTMTIEFLRARLLAERSTAKTARMRIDELENKVAQLERRLELEIEKRKTAEAAMQESLEKMLDSSSVSGGGGSTDSELEYRVAEHERDDKDGKYSDSYLELEDLCGSAAGPDRQSASNQGTASHFSDAQDTTTVPAETQNDEEQENHEERQEEQGISSRGELSLPCAEMLEPHNIHSDSDWATDNELDAKRRSSTAAARDEEFDSDSDGFSISLPSQLHLGQRELPGKIGRCLGSVHKSRSGNDWVRHVVDMLEHSEEPEPVNSAPECCNRPGDENDAETACQSTSSDTGALPYVSFAKYLGSSKLVEAEADGTTSETAPTQPSDSREGTRDEVSIRDQNASSGASAEPDVGVVGAAASCTGSDNSAPRKVPGISLRGRVFSSEEERVDEIFRALRAAKAQLKSSIQRRQVIEKQLFTSTT